MRREFFLENVYNQDYFAKVSESADYIRDIIKEQPKIAIVLGSGLGPLVEER
jgi:hypothetical protein